VGSYPTSTAAGDFNGDGYLDLAVTNNSSGTVSILLNNGNGTFTQSSTPGVGSAPFAATVGDFNGDGSLDLAVANAVSQTISILLNNGNGTFTQSSTVNVGTGPSSVTTGDFNGDGNADILTRDVGGSFIPGAFRVELTDTTGNVFDSAFMTTMSTDLNDQVMSTKDYNFDGTADVLLRNSVTGVWTMNYMHGTAAPTVGTLPGVTTNLCYTFKSDGDYDGNLVPDILLRKDAGGACGSPYPFLIYTMKGDFNYYQTGVPPIVQSPTYTMLDGDHDWNGDACFAEFDAFIGVSYCQVIHPVELQEVGNFITPAPV